MDIEPEFQVGPSWGGIGYKIGSNYSVMVISSKDQLKLMIWRAVDLSDPDGVLQGSGHNTRYLCLHPEGCADEPLIRRLLAEQLALYAAGESYQAKPKVRSPQILPMWIDEAHGESTPPVNEGLSGRERRRVPHLWDHDLWHRQVLGLRRERRVHTTLIDKPLDDLGGDADPAPPPGLPSRAPLGSPGSAPVSGPPLSFSVASAASARSRSPRRTR